MLPLEHRLPLRTSRRDLESHAQTFHSPLFTILLASQPNPASLSRFAVIVSKKISKSAVVRNKLKRQVLASVHELLPTINPGFDCLILTKKSLLEAYYSQIKSDLTSLLQKSGLI